MATTLKTHINLRLDLVKVYDNNGETFDRYTIYTPDGAVYGMSENALGYNLYLGEWYEVLEGKHLGKKLKKIPDSILSAVINRMIN